MGQYAEMMLGNDSNLLHKIADHRVVEMGGGAHAPMMTVVARGGKKALWDNAEVEAVF